MRNWRKILWMTALAGIVVAIAPLAIAAIGLAVNSQYLMTYHWLLYFSVPAGLLICLIAGLAGLFRLLLR